MAIHHVNKVIAGLSFTLGLAVFLISVWTFGSIVHNEQVSSDKASTRRGYKETNFKTELQFPTPARKEEVTRNDNYSNSTTIGNEEDSFKFWAKFERMPDFFKGIVIGCAWVAFIGALFQISSSLIILFSSAKNVLNRSKYLVAMHFLSFIILLTTFFTPLAYDRINERFYTMTSFNSQVKNGLHKLEEEGFFTFLCTDLHAYYSILIIDSIFLFFVMISISFILRFYNVPKSDSLRSRYQ